MLLATLTLLQAGFDAGVQAGFDAGATALDPIELSASPASVGVREQESAARIEPDEDMRVYYKGALRFETLDGNTKLQLGGRMNLDAVYIRNNRAIESFLRGNGGNGGEGATLDDAFQMRRARIYMAGTFNNEIDFKTEYDFSGGDSTFNDVFIAFRNFPLGKLTAGYFKEPFSLEQLESANHMLFIERSVADTLAPTPRRSTGVQLSDVSKNKRFSWAVGAFKESDSYGNFIGQADAEWAATGRLTYLPILSPDGDEVLHVGLAYSLRSPRADMARMRVRPENGVSPFFIDTGNFATDDESIIMFETSWTTGPWSLQGEYFRRNFSLLQNGSDITFQGYYVQAGYFFTNHYRPYDFRWSFFNSVDSLEEDAWQGKLRWSSVDLNEGPLTGGELNNIATGVNWYMNDHVRFMFELIHTDLEGVDDTFIGQVRCQVVW